MKEDVRGALRGAFAYGGLAVLWILTSDWLLFRLVGLDDNSVRIGTYKGVFFVAFTATLLYLLLRRNLRRARQIAEERRAMELEIEHSLEDKKELLQEVHHRVKNNLQIILSLVRLQSSFRPKEGSDIDALGRRVRTIAVVHDQLSVPEDVRGINLRRCLYDVVAEFRGALSHLDVPPEIRIEAEEMESDLDTAVPAMLMAGEKPALAVGQCGNGTERGLITLKLGQSTVPLTLELRYSEGNVPPPDTQRTQYVLAQSFAAQIGCALTADSNSSGFVISAHGR